MKYNRKYYNIKTRTSDGIVFDSHKEASRWEQLLLLQKAGKIVELKRQVKYELIPAQYETYERFSKTGKRLKDGKRLVERKVEYIADFVYHDVDTGELIVEDTKGVKTKDYIIKRKLLLLVHGVKIREI
jgi:hypothetical protein